MTSPAPDIGQQVPDTERELDAASRTFLRLAIIAVLAGAGGFIAVIAIFAPDQIRRLLNPAAAIVVALLSLWLLGSGRPRASLVVLVYGMWTVAIGIALVTAGVRTPVVFVIPVIIFFSGWLLGTRTAISVAALSVVALSGLAVAEYAALLPPPLPTSPFMHWVVQAPIFILAAITIVYLRRSHHRQLNEVRALTAELARQRAEAAAAVSLRRNQDLLDRTGRLARVGGWELEVASGSLTWTAETFRIHELELADTPPVDRAMTLYPPEARAAIESALKKAIEEGIGYDLELPMDTASGRRIWVRTQGEPQFVGSRVVRVSGAIQDISAQRRAAQALENSLNNLQCTLEATDDGIFGYDGTDTSGRLLFANDRFFELWNIPPGNAPVTGLAEVSEAARKLFIDPDREVRRIDEILALGVVHEDKVHLRDGRVLFRRSMPLPEGSQVSHVWSFRDITGEENTKAELKASHDEARRANAAKSDFLSRMSHELRTPMNGIMGMIDLVLRRTTDPHTKDRLGKAQRSSEHLLGVINDILDISKIEAERLTLETIDFPLRNVLEQLTDMVGHKAAEQNLKLRLDVAPEVAAASFRGDPLRLRQILLNLAGNAVKFTPHGTITVRVKQVAESLRDVLLRFEVEDTGIGIAAEDQQRLFTAFEQADGSMTRKYGGSGLGLAISKRLVIMMGGEIGVESVPGQGSTFWFTARLGKATVSAVPPGPTFVRDEAKARVRKEFAGARVLLAEDEPVNRIVARARLEDLGLVVDEAMDGAEALQSAQRQHYDLIMMDMQMPNLNGIDATRAIRADSLNMATPILALTANAFQEDRERCLAAGMNDHIAKPIDPGRLVETLLHWLTQSRAPGRRG